MTTKNLADNDTRRAIADRHIYTEQLLILLQKVDAGGVLTYKEAEAAIGLKCNAPHPGYRYLKSAIKIMLKEHKKVFDSVVNVGFKLIDSDSVATSSHHILKKKRQSVNRRMGLRIAAVNDDYDGLSTKAKEALNIARTLVAMDTHIFKPKQLKQISIAIEQKSSMLGFNETMDLFKD